jgi:hypothetical protein
MGGKADNHLPPNSRNHLLQCCLERRLNLYRSRQRTTSRTISVGYSSKLDGVAVRSLKVRLHSEQENVR